jgi:hypothetical protein
MSRLSVATVELCLKLPPSTAAAAPEVRLLVDLESSCSLHSETEVALQLDGKWAYRGSFVVEQSVPSSLLYRLGICAVPGTLWTLRIRDADDRYLLSDADTLDAPKSWLVGSCPLGAARAYGEVTSLQDFRARRASGVGHGRAPG